MYEDFDHWEYKQSMKGDRLCALAFSIMSVPFLFVLPFFLAKDIFSQIANSREAIFGALEYQSKYPFGTFRGWALSLFALVVMVVWLLIQGVPLWAILVFTNAFLLLLVIAGLLSGTIGYFADFALAVIGNRRAGR